MRTIDVTRLGIDRNFLRQCERQNIIKPKKVDSEWIVCKEYIPREYSQEDIEVVWNAFLYRKMGLSYNEIRRLTNGEKVNIRNSLCDLIEDCERQIEELKAIKEFMKYVKGIGFLPASPKVLLGSRSFNDYLADFIKLIDNDKKSKAYLKLAEQISAIDDIEAVNDSEIKDIENTVKEISCNVNEETKKEMTMAIMEIKQKTDLDSSSDEIQSIIYRIYQYQKDLIEKEDLTAWNFAMSYITVLSCDSDMSMAYKKILGEKAVDFLIESLIEFLKKEEPERYLQIIDE